MKNYVNGDRIQHVHGECGTIRYIGHVITSKISSDVYYGIEWDSGRGKHNGSLRDLTSHELVFYFKTRENKKNASFIKCDKLKLKVSLVESLKERYETTTTYSECIPAGVVKTSLGKEKTIELIGAESIRYILFKCLNIKKSFKDLYNIFIENYKFCLP